MTPEEQKAFEGYFDMFSTNGWKLIKDQLGLEMDNIKNELVFRSEGELALGKLRGRAEMINRFLGLEGQVEAMFNQAKEEAKENGDTV